jgi:hypothetical protein
MKAKISKRYIDGVKYYKGYKKFIFWYIPVTKLHRYKEDVKEILKVL